MDGLIDFWVGMTGEQIIICLLIAAQIVSWVRMSMLARTYHSVDKLILVHAWIIKLKLGVTTVKIHRNGDYEIVEPLNTD